MKSLKFPINLKNYGIMNWKLLSINKFFKAFFEKFPFDFNRLHYQEGRDEYISTLKDIYTSIVLNKFLNWSRISVGEFTGDFCKFMFLKNIKNQKGFVKFILKKLKAIRSETNNNLYDKQCKEFSPKKVSLKDRILIEKSNFFREKTSNYPRKAGFKRKLKFRKIFKIEKVSKSKMIKSVETIKPLVPILPPEEDVSTTAPLEMEVMN